MDHSIDSGVASIVLFRFFVVYVGSCGFWLCFRRLGLVDSRAKGMDYSLPTALYVTVLKVNPRLIPVRATPEFYTSRLCYIY